MPEPLKNVYSHAFFHDFVATIQRVVPRFSEKDFLAQVFDGAWPGRELKQRMRHIATALHQQLPGGFAEQATLLVQVAGVLEKNKRDSFAYMFLPDFLEQYGTEHPEVALAAMEQITRFTSCEFAIRPFLLQHPVRVMAQMAAWSRHPHPHVRRFSSEGCRPRLPWAMAIPALKKDPAPILPILENLKNDTSLFVRKSVANNLNDISKDHPDLVVNLVKQWQGVSAETDWIIRHGCRTLLKQAHASAYQLFQLQPDAGAVVKDVKLAHDKIRIGERQGFSFQLVVNGNTVQKIRLEYAVYYQKSNGKQSRKIFQLTEKMFPPNQSYPFVKEQRFQDFTTRKHYPGTHSIAIVVNGSELARAYFVLKASE